MNNQKWLEQLNPGDEVAVFWVSYHKLASVDATIKESVFVDGGWFSREDGLQERGPHVPKRRLVQPTPEIKAEVKRYDLLSALTSAKWDEFATEQLESIYALVVGLASNKPEARNGDPNES